MLPVKTDLNTPPLSLAECLEQELDEKSKGTCIARAFAHPKLLRKSDMEGKCFFLYVPNKALQKLAYSPNPSITFQMHNMLCFYKQPIDSVLFANFVAARFHIRLDVIADRCCEWVRDYSSLFYMQGDVARKYPVFLVARILSYSIKFQRSSVCPGAWTDYDCIANHFEKCEFAVLLNRDQENYLGSQSMMDFALRCVPEDGLHFVHSTSNMPQWGRMREVLYPSFVHLGGGVIARNFELVRVDLKHAFEYMKVLLQTPLPSCLIPRILLWFSTIFTPCVELSLEWNISTLSPSHIISATPPSSAYVKLLTRVRMDSFASDEFRLLLPPMTDCNLVAMYDHIHANFLAKVHMIQWLYCLMLQFRDRPFREFWALCSFVPIKYLPLSKNLIE